MRAIDFWVGIPLCFVLTQIQRIQSLLGLAAGPEGQPTTFCSCSWPRWARWSSLILRWPRKARELFPDAKLHFLCFQQIRSSVEMLNLLERGISSRSRMARRGIHPRHGCPFRGARVIGIDTVINLEAFVRYSSLLSFVSTPADAWAFIGSIRRGSTPAIWSRTGSVQLAHPRGTHLSRSCPRPRRAARASSSRQTAEDDGPAGGSDITTAATRRRSLLDEARAVHPELGPQAQDRGAEPECEQTVSHASSPTGASRISPGC